MDIFEQIKNKRLEEEKKRLSPYACQSDMALRLYPDKGDIRLEFARDVDRIIHALSYTRYIDKTQVYTDSKNDNISTRMTHVQFVSRAARTISRALELNEDLSEAIALGHDLGHTPFGHAGEHVLNQISLEKTGKCFAHNLNSVRVLTKLEKNGKGCNLTLQVLDGIMCHNGEMVKEKYTPVDKTPKTFFEEYERCLEDANEIKKIRPMTLEGCVVRISDIIGYIGKDIDDAKRLGNFDTKFLPKHIQEIVGNSNDVIMNNIILDIIRESYGKPYIQLSSQMYDALVELKAFNYKNIYDKATTEKIRQKYVEIFTTLYDVYEKALKTQNKENDIYRIFLDNMSKEYQEENTDAEKIIDYLAGMTDNFIERQYEKYK